MRSVRALRLGRGSSAAPSLAVQGADLLPCLPRLQSL